MFHQLYKSGLFALLLGTVVLASCTRYTEEENKALLAKLQTLKDSAAIYEKAAFASEAAKLNAVTKLIEDIRMAPKGAKIDTANFPAIFAAQTKVKESMYSLETLGNEDFMIQYDDACAVLLKTVDDFAAKNPDFTGFKIAYAHYTDLKAADAADIVIRNSQYNEAARRYNDLLKASADQLEYIGDAAKAFTAIPYFYGAPTERNEIVE